MNNSCQDVYQQTKEAGKILENRLIIVATSVVNVETLQLIHQQIVRE
jgi:hypothetical protein